MDNNIINEDNKPSASSIVDDLLKKYNLNENIDVVRKKVTKNVETNKSIISYLSKCLAMNIITEKNLHNSLQNIFKTDPETTKKITLDIKNNIAPFIKNIEVNRPKDDNEQVTTPPQSLPPIAIKKTDIPKKRGPDNYREPIE